MSDDSLPVVPLDGPAAQRLADLVSIGRDLQFVQNACHRMTGLLAVEDDAEKDSVLMEALWTSALVVYARCFATGKRFGLTTADIAALPGEPVAAHDYLLGMRNKHIAHSVNPFEQVRVGAVLGINDEGTFDVVGVARLALRHVSGPLEGVSGLWQLMDALLRRTADLADELDEDVRREARAVGIEELRGRETMRVVVPHPDRATRPRER